jgi:Zn-dependent protease with chaperone function
MSLAAVQRFDKAGTKEAIFGGFRGEIQPVRLSPVYRAALAIVALAMVLLPLAYVSLVGGAAYGVVWFAMHGWPLLNGIGSLKWRGFVFAIPLVTGAILVVFMIKPLFARPARRAEPRRLGREEEPLLFAFVDRICETVGAPRPREIHIDGQVNASASLRRGFFSLFSDDLVLTLGLPLVAGLSLPQLAGVLAHEFGHFAQRAGLRLSYVIRSVNAWFARVVYERDQYDEQLLHAAKNSDFRLQIVLWVALAFVWISRKILWALMMIGHALSSFLLRQMEFDADRYEARLVGRDVARSTFRDLFGLTLCFQHTVMSLEGLWQEGRLGDRFPRLVAAQFQSLSDQAPRLHDEYLSESKTGVFDTHPSDRDRIASIGRESGVGVFACELPATALFRDFDAVEKSFSSAFYGEIFGERFDESDLVSTEAAVAARLQAADDAKVLTRYLGREPDAAWPFPLPSSLPSPPADPAAELREARRVIEAQREAYAREVQAHGEACERAQSALMAENALRTGLSIQAESFGLPGGDLQDAEQAGAQAAAEIAGIESRLEALEQTASRRLSTALAMLPPSAVEREPAGTGPDRPQVSRLLSCAVFLNQMRPRLAELQRRQTDLAALDSWTRSYGPQQTAKRLGELSGPAHSLLQGLAEDLAARPYPLGDRGAEVTLAQIAKLDEPIGDTVEAITRAGAAALAALDTLSTSVLAHLARAAEQVERSLGLDSQSAESTVQ